MSVHVTLSSSLLMFVSLSFYFLLSFVTYSDIGLKPLLKFTFIVCKLCV